MISWLGIILDKSRKDSYFMNPITYLKETLSELRQVTWPTRKQTLTLSAIVVVASLVMAAYVGALDFGLKEAGTWT